MEIFYCYLDGTYHPLEVGKHTVICCTKKTGENRLPRESQKMRDKERIMAQVNQRGQQVTHQYHANDRPVKDIGKEIECYRQSG